MTLLEELKAYVGFGPEDEAALQALRPIVVPHLERITDHFYECILRHPGASRAITGGEQQVKRLQRTLAVWLDSGLAGPHDEAWYERRARIGRVHVQISLPQRYMFTAMNVMRTDVREIIEMAYVGAEQLAERVRVNDALDRLFDMELAIMLHTYSEDSEAKMRRRERLATVGQLAASIAHELRNPLSVMESSVYLIRRKVTEDPKMTRHLDKIEAQIRTSGGIITDLLEMTRDRPPSRRATPVSELFAEAEQALQVPPNIKVVRELPEDIVLDVEPRLMVRALVNLVQNSVGALRGEPGRITLRGARLPDAAELTVLDDGPGFTREMLAAAFEPLVTGRESGVGLGLPLVHRICERHGGEVRVGNREEGGAVVTLRLPLPEDDRQEST